MASIIIYVRSTKTEANKNVKLRMKVNAYYGKTLVTAHASLGVDLPKKVWEPKIYVKKAYLKDYQGSKDTITAIDDFVAARLNAMTEETQERISSEWLKATIQSYWCDVEATKKEIAKARETEAKRETLTQYIKRYVEEISTGKRLNIDTSRAYSANTIKSFKNSMALFLEFQGRKRYDFDDVDIKLHAEYTAWLASVKGYKANTIGKCIKDLKSIMNKSLDEELHDNIRHRAKSFKVQKIEVDNVYLTQPELDAMYQLDLLNKAPGYELARDIFCLGCCIAQRVSDYTHIKEDDIITDADGKVKIKIIQQKGGKKVIVPLKRMAREILTKYDNKLPYIWAQNLNENIKEVARWAGITEVVKIESTKGGKKITETFEKCDLISSHTARRTGATLMYLGGMDVYDICKVTGHSGINMLRKYIKADELESAAKMGSYDYFNE